LIANRWCNVDAEFCQNRISLLELRKCTGVYLCNAILVTEIFCYRYSTINNNAKKKCFSTKFGNHFCNLLQIKCTKLYLDSFRFDISIAQSLGVYFFYRTQCSKHVSGYWQRELLLQADWCITAHSTSTFSNTYAARNSKLTSKYQKIAIICFLEHNLWIEHCQLTITSAKGLADSQMIIFCRQKLLK